MISKTYTLYTEKHRANVCFFKITSSIQQPTNAVNRIHRMTANCTRNAAANHCHSRFTSGGFSGGQRRSPSVSRDGHWEISTGSGYFSARSRSVKDNQALQYALRNVKPQFRKYTHCNTRSKTGSTQGHHCSTQITM